MSTVLLDSHVLHWFTSEPQQISATARQVIRQADELVVASVTWYELAWLAQHHRISLTIPISSWLDGLSAQVRTVGTTPAIALSAVTLPRSFPADPADRVIYATAIESGWPLVTRDERLRRHKHPRKIVVW